MNQFLKIFKNFIPRKARLIIHIIYFDYLMTFLEKRLFLINYILETYSYQIIKILLTSNKSLIRHNLYENYELEAIEKMIWDNNFIDLGSSIDFVLL